MANPFYVDPTGGRDSGEDFTRLGQNLLSAVERREEKDLMAKQRETQAQAADDQQERLRSGGDALKQAIDSGDPVAVRDVMLQYPELQDTAKNAFGFTNEQTEQVAKDTYRRVLANPDNAQQYLQQGVQRVQELGGSPTNMSSDLQMFQQDPEAALRNVQLGASMFPDLQEAYQSQQQPDEQMTPYQRAQIDLRQEDQRLRELEAQQSQETNDLRRQQLEQEIELRKQKIEDAKLKTDAAQGKQDASLDMATEAGKLAEEIANDDAFEDIVGTIDPLTPTISGKSQDLINKSNRLQSLLTVDNLKLMSGVLTDRDIGFLTNVASGLNVTDGGIKGSEKGVRKRLQDIAEKMKQATKDKQPQQQSQTVNWSDL